jgi:hypothetical protein
VSINFPSFPPSFPKFAGAGAMACSECVKELARSPRECLPLLLIVPTYRGHFGPAAHLLRSLLSFAIDPQSASLRFVVSDQFEFIDWTRTLSDHFVSNARCCVQRTAFDVGVVTLSTVTQPWNVSVVPLTFRPSARQQYTAPPSGNKFLYQFTKKLYAARFFSYEFGLLLDADSDVVRCFSFQALFNSFFQDRTVYASQPTTRSYCNAILPAPSPSRGLASQGHRPDGWPVPLGHNYYGWFVESATIADLFAHVESASRDSLYAAASAAFVRQRCFEYATYQQVYVRVRVEPNPNPNPNPDPTPNLNPNPR